MTKSFSAAALVAIAAALALPNPAFAAERGPAVAERPASGAIRDSKPVTIEQVGKLVERDVYQVNPDELRGRVLVLPNTPVARIICIGIYDSATGCHGWLIRTGEDRKQ